MLAIRCELLLGSYQAADPFGASDVAEWPPHPYRLHAALVGAACEAGGDRPLDDALDALRWLEAQGPPVITCSLVPSARTVATSWVPRNPTRGAEWGRYAKQGTAVNRVGRSFPTAVPASPVLTFAWRDAGDPPQALTSLVESVPCLGSSRSPVACALVPDGSEPTFSPSRTGTWQVRVAAPGITDALLAARFTHPQPVRAAIVGYEARGAAREDAAPVFAAPFSELFVRRVLNATQDAADTPLIGAALRGAVLARAEDDAPAALHGHAEDRRHAAYLTLADVGHTGARGAVRGVALALPNDLDRDEHERCLRAFAAVDPLTLGAGRRPLKLSDETGELATLRPERWIGPAAGWATVTPVILDRFPRGGRTARDELLATLRRAGLPDPAELELLAGPPLAGAASAGALRGPVPPGLRVHARVRFPGPVHGPVLAGRGRFRGIGCFLPERRA